MKKRNSIWKILLWILGILAALAAVVFIVMTIAYNHRSDPADRKQYETDNPHIAEGMPMVSAHRSGAGIAPEETMRAFRTCVEDDSFEVEYYEFDLHITKDDILVLLHDDELDRTSDCVEVFGTEHCRPEDYTYEQLRTLNMGAKFVNENGEMPYSDLKGDEVPDDLKILDLDTILDYLESKGKARYIIEIKNTGETGMRGVDILYRSLKERNMVDRVIFGCFHAEVSDYKDEAYPDLIRGAYAKELVEFYISSLLGKKDYSPKFGVLQMPFNDTAEDYHINMGTVSVVNYAHAHNLAVQYWTVNNEEDARYLMSIGADAITTDYPDMADRIRKEMYADQP